MITMQNNDYTLVDELKNLASVQVYENGKVRTINKGEQEFLTIFSNLKNLFLNGYLTPALGVSLHSDTVKAMKTDNWIKLNFLPTQTKDDLPFDALVFRLDDCYGFNLIRQHNGQFSGRCLYFNLNQQTDLRRLI